MKELDMIRFSEVTVTGARRIDAQVEHDGQIKHLWFELSQPVVLSDDALFIALATLCGRAFKSAHFDLAPSRQAIEQMKAFTLAEITTSSEGFAAPTPRRGNVLSFSGGFDSLAAFSLMPNDTHLVSLDFMGRFARERSFYEKHFDTITVQTNLLETGLQKNSWAFMGLAAILTGQHTRAEFHTFGSILEAGPDNLSASPAAAKNVTFPPFAAAGFRNAPYVAGLTEIGTLQILMHYKPEHIRDSLTSLASPGEEKLYRKQVLTQVVAQRRGVTLDLALTPAPAKVHFAFGQNFALDLLALYVAKHAGPEVADGLVTDIPAPAFELAERLDLTFFERANTNLFQHFPAELVSGLAARLADAGVVAYTERDWADFQEIRKFLGAYHPAALR